MWCLTVLACHWVLLFEYDRHVFTMPSWHTTHFLQRQVENIGYKSDFNSALYAHMRKSTTAEDVLNAPPINELW